MASLKRIKIGRSFKTEAKIAYKFYPPLPGFWGLSFYTDVFQWSLSLQILLAREVIDLSTTYFLVTRNRAKLDHFFKRSTHELKNKCLDAIIDPVMKSLLLKDLSLEDLEDQSSRIIMMPKNIRNSFCILSLPLIHGKSLEISTERKHFKKSPYILILFEMISKCAFE